MTRRRKTAGGEPPSPGTDAGADDVVSPSGADDRAASAAHDESGSDAARGGRRRRGSRGGRGRHKAGGPATPAAEGVDPGGGPQPEPAGQSKPTEGPRLPLAPLVPVAAGPAGEATAPPRADGTAPPVEAQGGPVAAPTGTGEAAVQATGEAPSKRRRRGSRGGRRHTRPEAVAAESAAEPTARPGAVGPTDMKPTAATAAAKKPATAGPGQHAGPAKRSRSRRRAPSAAAQGVLSEAVAAPAATEAAAAEPAAAAGAEPAETPAEPGRDDAEAARKRRRRGARGGRRVRSRRETAGEDEVAAPGALEPGGEPLEPPREGGGELPPGVEEVVEDEKPAAKPGRGAAARGRDRRRPKAIVRQDEGSGVGTPPVVALEGGQRRPTVVAEPPKRKIILVTDDGHELRVALVEDGRLAEIYIERPDKKSYLGDIYQGKVENVLPGIDAAFIDFGLEKNGFLYVDEVQAPDGERRPRRIGEALKNGQQVLVQVTKDPMGSKGARLSTKISLAGRYLVYVPGGSGVGVSRRLKQSERERLRDISKELKPKNAGLIVRTIAEGHGLDDLKRDLRYLARLWSRLKKKSETVKPPGLVHKEVDISIEVARDLFNDSCESLIVDDVKRHKAIVAFLDKEAPELVPKVHQHTGSEPLFEAYGIEDQIARALERRVPLESGGNLVIDHAEALTVIDVNTGRFAGGKRLEDTITHTNLEAAKEVVRQLRLRDIGGIIIIDFIDMAHAKNREMVLATLEAELETDRTKTYVVELSPLGLVEMTRQNTTDGARGILTRSCPTCLGKARVLSDETMALSVERRLRALARKSQAKAWLIELNGGVAERLGGQRLKRLEKETGRRIFLEGSTAQPVDAFRVLAEGNPAHVMEQRVPLREGQEVEVELEYSLTYSPRDAVGYVDGYMVIVEGGRQYLGEKRTVRVTNTSRTGAHATVAKGGGRGGG